MVDQAERSLHDGVDLGEVSIAGIHRELERQGVLAIADGPEASTDSGHQLHERRDFVNELRRRSFSSSEKARATARVATAYSEWR